LCCYVIGIIHPPIITSIACFFILFSLLYFLPQAVQEFDADFLGASGVTALLQHLPTPDEVATIQRFLSRQQQQQQQQQTEESQLGRAEEYLLEMSKVPQAQQRLMALAAALAAQETKQHIQSETELLIKSANEVGQSHLSARLFVRLFVGLLVCSVVAFVWIT
jgi:hypothetical protein